MNSRRTTQCPCCTLRPDPMSRFFTNAERLGVPAAVGTCGSKRCRTQTEACSTITAEASQTSWYACDYVECCQTRSGDCRLVGVGGLPGLPGVRRSTGHHIEVESGTTSQKVRVFGFQNIDIGSMQRRPRVVSAASRDSRCEGSSKAPAKLGGRQPPCAAPDRQSPIDMYTPRTHSLKSQYFE